MKAYLIARVSTEDQEDALPAQVYRLNDYSKRNNFNSELFELKESAYKEGRKLFGEIVERIKLETDKVVIVFDKIDRFSRDSSSEETNSLRKLCKANKIELHFPSDNLVLDYRSPAQAWFMLGMGEATAEYYSRSVSDNVRRRFEQMRRDGLWTGVAPFGYKNVNLPNDKKWIETEPLEAEMVRHIYELYSSGTYSLLLIRKKLQDVYSCTISTSQLDRILKNPFYVGQMRIEGNLYPHNYDKLITDKVFESVKQVRDGYKVAPKRWGGLPYIYRNFIKCATCGSTITFEKKKGKYIYGHCTQYKGKHGAVYLLESEFTKQLKVAFKQIQMSQEAFTEVSEKLATDLSEDEKNKVNKVAHLNTEIAKYRNRIDTIYEEHLDSKIPDDFYENKFREYTDKKLILEKQKNAFELSNNNRFEDIQYLLKLLTNSEKIFERGKFERKRSFMNKTLSNLLLDGEILRWEFNYPYDIVAKCNETSNWLGMRDSNPR